MYKTSAVHPVEYPIYLVAPAGPSSPYPRSRANTTKGRRLMARVGSAVAGARSRASRSRVASEGSAA